MPNFKTSKAIVVEDIIDFGYSTWYLVICISFFCKLNENSKFPRIKLFFSNINPKLWIYGCHSVVLEEKKG